MSGTAAEDLADSKDVQQPPNHLKGRNVSRPQTRLCLTFPSRTELLTENK